METNTRITSTFLLTVLVNNNEEKRKAHSVKKRRISVYLYTMLCSRKYAIHVTQTLRDHARVDDANVCIPHTALFPETIHLFNQI